MGSYEVILRLYWGYMEIMEKKMETTIMSYMGGCQNYALVLGTLNIRRRIMIGTIILTTTHM